MHERVYAAAVLRDGLLCGYKIVLHPIEPYSMGSHHFGGLRPDDPRIEVRLADFAEWAEAEAWVNDFPAAHPETPDA